MRVRFPGFGNLGTLLAVAVLAALAWLIVTQLHGMR